jgi:hypothetical protein
LDQIVSFIKGQSWDDADEVRLMAFSALGKYLQNHMEPELLKLLTDFAEAPASIDGFVDNRDYAQAFLQACAYVHLGMALHISENDLPDEEGVEKIIQDGGVHELPYIKMAREYLKQFNH